MRHSIKLLLCCLCLAGCAEAEAEVATEAVDFSKPVTPGPFYVKCGTLEGITMYPVPLPGNYTVEGKYSLSSSRNDLSVQDYLRMIPGDKRVVVMIPENRDNGVNANFFLHGLADGCTGVFAASEITLMGTEKMLQSTWDYGLTHSPVVDEVYLAFARDSRTSADVNKNALFIDISAWSGPKTSGAGSFMVFKGEVYADKIVYLDE